jgi:hypothetical protein
MFTLTPRRNKITDLLSTAGFCVRLKWPECQVINMNSYFSGFKFVITSEDTPCRFRCASAFERLRTQRSGSSCHLSLRALYSKPTQLDRPRHGSVVGEIQVQTQAGSSGICGGQIGSGTVLFFRRIPVFPCQCHSTIAPYSFIHLPPTLYTVSLPVLQFPLSVSFHQHSIPVYSPVTDATQSVSTASAFK